MRCQFSTGNTPASPAVQHSWLKVQEIGVINIETTSVCLVIRLDFLGLLILESKVLQRLAVQWGIYRDHKKESEETEHPRRHRRWWKGTSLKANRLAEHRKYMLHVKLIIAKSIGMQHFNASISQQNSQTSFSKRRLDMISFSLGHIKTSWSIWTIQIQLSIKRKAQKDKGILHSSQMISNLPFVDWLLNSKDSNKKILMSSFVSCFLSFMKN